MHPSGDILLLYSDGETDAAETLKLDLHLGACEQCGTALKEIRRTAADCVLYRKTLETVLPAPPAPWDNIYGKFEQAGPWYSRFRIWRLAVPVAAAAALFAVIYYRHANAPSVRADELLRKAAIAAPHKAGARKIRIRTNSKAAAQTLLRAANYPADDPLSARAYSDWRDRLPAKSDFVAELPAAVQIRTIPSSGDLAEARLTLATSDLHAVEATLRFKNSDFIEMHEMNDDAIAAKPAPAVGVAPVEVRPALPKSEPGATVPVVLATPADELRVFSALHALQADLGEPVEVRRSGATVFVDAAGLSAGRQQQFRMAFDGQPSVQLRFDSPASVAAGDGSATNTVVRRDTAIQLAIERHFGSKPQAERFGEQILESSDGMMTRAHALRRLSQRFPAAIEAQFSPADRDTLASLRREHAAAFADRSAALRRAMDPVLTALGAPVAPNPASPVSPSWQAAADNAFESARQTERLVAAVLGGSPGETVSEAEFARQSRQRLARLEAVIADLSRF